jgi:hypothetical protein
MLLRAKHFIQYRSEASRKNIRIAMLEIIQAYYEQWETHEDEFAPPIFTLAPVPLKSSPAAHDVVALASDDAAGVEEEGLAQSGSPYAPLMVAWSLVGLCWLRYCVGVGGYLLPLTYLSLW